jgi:hypothetical protein
MNKMVKSIVIIAVVVIAFGAAGAVFAQTTNPQNTGLGTQLGYDRTRGGRGGRSGYGKREGFQTQNMEGYHDGLLHDLIMAEFAEALNLGVDELKTRIEGGEKLSEIALSTGLTFDEFRTLWDEVREVVLEQAVAEGLLTQEDVDNMNGRFARVGRKGNPRGVGQRMYGEGIGVCPYGQTTP